MEIKKRLETKKLALKNLVDEYNKNVQIQAELNRAMLETNGAILELQALLEESGKTPDKDKEVNVKKE